MLKKLAWLITSLKKIAQGYQGGTRQILKVHTLNYHFQQKHCIYTQLDGHYRILIKSTRLIPIPTQLIWRYLGIK